VNKSKTSLDKSINALIEYLEQLTIADWAISIRSYRWFVTGDSFWDIDFSI
jgi:hypothetical protein